MRYAIAKALRAIAHRIAPERTRMFSDLSPDERHLSFHRAIQGMSELAILALREECQYALDHGVSKTCPACSARSANGVRHYSWCPGV